MESREELEATLEKISKGKAEVELKIVAKYKLLKVFLTKTSLIVYVLKAG